MGWGVSSTIRFADGPPSSAEGCKGWRQSRHKLLFRVLRTRGGGRRPSASFPIAPATPSGRSPYNLSILQRWQVAAALSAAVTTPKPIGDRPHSQAEPTPKDRPTPNASRSSGEGVWGRGASLREAASPPESPPPPSLREGSAREGSFSTENLPSLAIPFTLYFFH